MRSPTPWLALTLLALAGCQSPAPGGAGRFVLGPEAAGASLPLPVAANPGAEAQPEPPSTPPPRGGSGGSGGGAAPAAPLSGRVADAFGRPLPGAAVSGAAETVVSGPDGAFSLTAVGAPLLTASLEGYVSQTSGPPYRFALRPVAHEAGATFTLSGTTQPPAPGAAVVYADNAGTRAGSVVGADGTFSLTVASPAAGASEGMLVVHRGLALPAVPRFRVLQVPDRRLGALALAPGEAASGLVVPVQAVTDRVPLAPAAPEGLAPFETVVSLVGPGGTSVPLAGTSGVWPTEVPALVAPGFMLAVSLIASDEAGSGLSVVELVDPPAGATAAPVFLPLPALTLPPVGQRTLRWSQGGTKSAVALYRAGATLPAWETVTAAASADLPALADEAASYEVEVQAWDTPEVPPPSQVEGPAANRRYATRRAPWPL